MIRHGLKALRERGSPGGAAQLVRREARARLTASKAERRVSRAGKRGRPVIIGPFLGEVGFELLYWIPMARRLLAQHGIDRERVVAVSRGGIASWYRDIAAQYVDVFDLIEADDFSRELDARRLAVGDQKQLTIEPLDRRLLAAVRNRVGAGTVIHPALMFARMRRYWNGHCGLSLVTEQLQWERIEPPDPLPETSGKTIAFKPYFSTCFPDVPENRVEVAHLLESLADESPTVSLPSPRGFGEDGPLGLPDVPGMTHLNHVDKRHFLGAQTSAVAASRLLVTTYGGFSYLGPLLGVPTIALYSDENFNPAHRAAIEAASTQLGPAPYVVALRGEVPLAQSLLAEAMR